MRPVEMLRGEISVGDDLGEFAAWGVCNVRDDALRGLVASCTCLGLAGLGWEDALGGNALWENAPRGKCSHRELTWNQV